MTKTLTPKELAQVLGTDGKTARRFLRSDASGVADQAPGKGGRWAIEATKVRSLKAKFPKWEKDQAAQRADALERKAAKAREEADAEVEDDDTDEVEIDLSEDEVEEVA